MTLDPRPEPVPRVESSLSSTPIQLPNSLGVPTVFRSYYFVFILTVGKLESPLNQNTQQSSDTVAEPCSDDISRIAAWKVILKEPETREPFTDTVRQPDAVEPRRFMNFSQATFHEIIGAEVEQQAAYHRNKSVATAFEETSMDAVQLPTDLFVLLKRWTTNDYV